MARILGKAPPPEEGCPWLQHGCEVEWVKFYNNVRPQERCSYTVLDCRGDYGQLQVPHPVWYLQVYDPHAKAMVTAAAAARDGYIRPATQPKTDED